MKSRNKRIENDILSLDAKNTNKIYETKDVTYLTFELIEKSNKEVIGYASLYILNFKRDNIVNIKEYAMENTEDLLIFIDSIENSYGKKIFLEKIYIKESHRNKGYGKDFFKEYIPKISLKYKVDEIYIHPAPLVIGEKNRHISQFRLIEFYEKIGFSLLNSNINNIIMKKDIKSTL